MRTLREAGPRSQRFGSSALKAIVQGYSRNEHRVIVADAMGQLDGIAKCGRVLDTFRAPTICPHGRLVRLVL